LNFLRAEYDDAVQNVRNLMKIREMMASGNVNVITNLDDAVKINYDTSWLPPYAELRVGPVNAWLKFKRRWDKSSTSKGKAGHPVMMASDEGNAERTCYGFGKKGHMRGEDICRAGKDAIWGGAPKAYLGKVANSLGRHQLRLLGKDLWVMKRKLRANSMQPVIENGLTAVTSFMRGNKVVVKGLEITKGVQKERVKAKGKENPKAKDEVEEQIEAQRPH
jgi:hypothetical protein